MMNNVSSLIESESLPFIRIRFRATKHQNHCIPVNLEPIHSIIVVAAFNSILTSHRLHCLVADVAAYISTWWTKLHSWNRNHDMIKLNNKISINLLRFIKIISFYIKFITSTSIWKWLKKNDRKKTRSIGDAKYTLKFYTLIAAHHIISMSPRNDFNYLEIKYH